MTSLKLTKKYDRYPKYKDSDVEWVGEIPEGWDVQRLKQAIARQYPGIWGDEAKGDENDIKCLRVADFDFDHRSFGTVETVRNIQPHERARKILRNPSLLIEKSGGGEKQPVGRAVMFDTDDEMVCANFIDVLNLKPDFDINFVAYQLFAAYKGGLNKKAIKQNTGIQNLDTKQYFSEFFPFPSSEQQKRIAAYLDEKTALIDAIIEKKKKQIELLREKRAAIINRAVTKGLDPKAKLVDSGIEWIGKIPEWWEVKKLKYVAKVEGGYAFSSDSYADNSSSGVLLIRITEVKDQIAQEGRRYVPSEMWDILKPFRVQQGDILVTLTGYVGETSVFPLNEKALLNQRAGKIQPFQDIYSKFLYYCTKPAAFRTFLSLHSKSSAQENVSNSDVGEFVLPFPSRQDQQAIAEYLDGQCETYRQAQDMLEKSITLLQEFKSALISHVVTGKVRV